MVPLQGIEFSSDPQTHLLFWHVSVNQLDVHCPEFVHSSHRPLSWHFCTDEEQDPCVVPSPTSSVFLFFEQAQFPSTQKGVSESGRQEYPTLSPHWHWPL